MRLRTTLRPILCAAAASACTSRGGPVSAPADPFGRVIVRVGTTPVVGAWGRDSVVAVYIAETGTLQIEGAHVGGPRVPAVRVLLSCAALPTPGVYPIAAGPRALVQVQAVLGDEHAGAWGARGGATHVLVTDSASAGVLELDTLDVAAGRVSGRFRASVRDLDERSAAPLPISGTFWGRVRTADARPWRGRPLRLSPVSERDCGAIRRPLAAATAGGRPAVRVLTSNEALKLPGSAGTRRDAPRPPLASALVHPQRPSA